MLLRPASQRRPAPVLAVPGRRRRQLDVGPPPAAAMVMMPSLQHHHRRCLQRPRQREGVPLPAAAAVAAAANGGPGRPQSSAVGNAEDGGGVAVPASSSQDVLRMQEGSAERYLADVCGVPESQVDAVMNAAVAWRVTAGGRPLIDRRRRCRVERNMHIVTKYLVDKCGVAPGLIIPYWYCLACVPGLTSRVAIFILYVKVQQMPFATCGMPVFGRFRTQDITIAVGWRVLLKVVISLVSAMVLALTMHYERWLLTGFIYFRLQGRMAWARCSSWRRQLCAASPQYTTGGTGALWSWQRSCTAMATAMYPRYNLFYIPLLSFSLQWLHMNGSKQSPKKPIAAPSINNRSLCVDRRRLALAVGSGNSQ